MATKVPAWPLTRSPVLDEFKGALQRRSKAIKHSVFDWTLEHLVIRVDECDYEGLWNYWELTRPTLSLTVWEDGDLTVKAREISAGRAIFALSFFAELGSLDCAALVATLEATTTQLCVRDSNEDAKSRILELWSPYGPYEVTFKPH